MFGNATRMLLLSDLGIGSDYSLAPDYAVKLILARNPGLDEFHKLTRNEWNLMKKTLANTVDIVVVNGECTDGPQYANRGRELWTADINEQCRGAANLLRELSFKKAYITKGTPYHSGDNMNLDEVVADQIGAWCGHELSLKVKDFRFHISHTIGVSSSYYRTTAIAREMLSSEVQKKEYGHYNGIIRSHAHYYVAVEYGGQWGLITPCWQGRTPYMVRKGLAMTPKLGYVIVDIYDDHIERSAHLFSMPQIQDEVYVESKEQKYEEYKQ